MDNSYNSRGSGIYTRQIHVGLIRDALSHYNTAQIHTTLSLTLSQCHLPIQYRPNGYNFLSLSLSHTLSQYHVIGFALELDSPRQWDPLKARIWLKPKPTLHGQMFGGPQEGIFNRRFVLRSD